jgi:hypothetical protein
MFGGLCMETGVRSASGTRTPITVVHTVSQLVAGEAVTGIMVEGVCQWVLYPGSPLETPSGRG